MSNQNTTLAFIAGALAGGIAGILLAPERGSRTRQIIRDEAGNLVESGQDRVKSAVEDVQSKAEDLASGTKERARDVANVAEGQVDAVKEAVKTGTETYRREMEQRRQPEAS